MERIELQLYAVFPVVIILISTIVKHKNYSSATKVFMIQCCSVIVMLILDMLGFYWMGVPGDFSRRMNFAADFLYYLFMLITVSPWLSYIDLLLFDDVRRLKKRLFYLQPAIIGIILMFSTISTPFVFYIDEANMYHRGIGSYVITVLSWVPLIYSCVLFLRNRKRLKPGTQGVVALFVTIPFTGNFLQIIFPGTSLGWPFSVFMLLITYIFLEIRGEQRDYLTGLLIRSQVDRHFQFLIDNGAKTGGFSLVLIDMDDFRKINENYGHQMGDQALCAVSKILQKELNKEEKAARYGGDEFILCLETAEPEAVEHRMNIIRDRLNQINGSGAYPYQLEFSWGYSIFNADNRPNLETMYADVDRSMYARKKENKTKVKARG